MVKMKKYRFVLFAYFSKNMTPDEILLCAEENIGKHKGNEIISMKDYGVVER